MSEWIASVADWMDTTPEWLTALLVFGLVVVVVVGGFITVAVVLIARSGPRPTSTERRPGRRPRTPGNPTGR